MNLLVRIDRFARIHFYGYTCLFPLLGAVSVDASGATVLALLVICLPFHLYGGVLNDVVDLEIDRTEPKRAEDALVQGRVGQRAALLFALVQLPILFLLVELFGGSLRAHALLAGSLLALTAYDLWSKRCPFPPLTDATHGISWVFFIYFAVELAGAEPNLLTALAAAYAVVYTLLMNGVHGCMRDLHNDLACGARTTAIWLGIRPDPERRMRVPAGARRYSVALVLALVALALLTPLNASGYGAIQRLSLVAGVLVVGASCVYGMLRSLQPWREGWDTVFRIHMLVLWIPMFLALLPAASAWLGVTLLAVVLLPMLLIEHVQLLFGPVPLRDRGRS